MFFALALMLVSSPLDTKLSDCPSIGDASFATTVNAPANFGQEGTAGLTHSYVLAQQRLQLAMMDSLDPIATMMASLKGDVAGSGSDTLRVTDIDNVGFARRFSDLASETDTIPASSLALGYTDLTVALSGLAHEETYQRQILSQVEGYSLDDLIAMVPMSWAATLRYKACVTALSIATAVGSTSTYASVDDYIDLVTAFHETLGAGARGVPVNTFAPQILTRLLASFRSEPAFQASLEGFSATQGVRTSQLIQNFAGMGMDIALTDDVQQSGGAYQGFSATPGGIGWGRASTDKIRPSGAGRAMYMPQYGLFLEEISRGENGKARYEARTWVGTALGSTNLFFLRRFLSKV